MSQAIRRRHSLACGSGLEPIPQIRPQARIGRAGRSGTALLARVAYAAFECHAADFDGALLLLR